MTDLSWRQSEWGYECAGYRIVCDDDDSKPWRLESIPGGLRRPDFGRVTTRHRSREDAVSFAERLEEDHLRRTIAAVHFALAAAGLALFTVAAQFIGSLPGLLVVAAGFYLALRSLGNGLGVVLQEAWGWTRVGRQRSSLLERMVPALVTRWRRRRLAMYRFAPEERVRTLIPDP